MNIDDSNEAAEKILAKYSKNYTKWEESGKPLFSLQLNGHEALNAIKEALKQAHQHHKSTNEDE